MIPKLYAARYDDYTYTGTNPVEVFNNVQELGIRWNITNHGVQIIELTVAAHSEFDAYDRYKNHIGHLIAVYDSFIDRCITGNVYEIQLNGRSVTYICGGPPRRLNDLVYYVSNMADLTLPTDDTDVTIKDILDDWPGNVSSDHSNIDSSGVNTGGWKPTGLDDGTNTNPGQYVGDCIKELARIGKSTKVTMDFYLVDPPFNGLQIQKPLPYFKARSTTASPDWQFSKADIAAGGLTLGRHIWDLASHTMVGFGRLSGTSDGDPSTYPPAGGNSAHLFDASATFHASGVRLGDKVINLTDETYFSVEAFVDETNDDELDMVNAPAGTEWANTDLYVIELGELQWTTQTSDAEFWTSAARPIRPEMDATQAALYRDLYHAIYKSPVLQQSFVLTAPKIKDGNGALWPLWRPLFGDSFYMRANDLFPEAALFSASDDREKSFMAVMMDYEYSTNRLRIVPSTKDSRLDVLIADALADKRRINEIVSAQ